MCNHCHERKGSNFKFLTKREITLECLVKIYLDPSGLKVLAKMSKWIQETSFKLQWRSAIIIIATDNFVLFLWRHLHVSGICICVFTEVVFLVLMLTCWSRWCVWSISLQWATVIRKCEQPPCEEKLLWSFALFENNHPHFTYCQDHPQLQC